MKRCAITGFAAGIGRALALCFSEAGYHVVGIDIDAEGSARTLEELGARGSSILADLARPEDLERILESLRQEPPVEVFIHNAGINRVGRFRHSDSASDPGIIDVNLTAAMVLTCGMLRNRRLASGGCFVFVSSLSRFLSYPGAAVYAATKDGLAAYARSLSVALAPAGIHVLTVYPGPVRTAQARRSSPRPDREHRRMPPERLADAIFRAVKGRRRTLIPGLSNQLLAAFGHLWGPLAERAMKRALLDPLVRPQEGSPRSSPAYSTS